LDEANIPDAAPSRLREKAEFAIFAVGDYT
jgi:hypothetical protein